jgi:hypothetical protein
MNTIEDRIRAAARAAADTVPQDSVPPLRLPPEQGSARSRPGWGGWARRLTPLAAAVAVVVVVIAAVGIGRAMHSPADRAPTTTSGPGPVLAGPPISSYVSSGQVPPYYVAITSRGNPNLDPSYAVVKATVSGKTLATIGPSVAGGTILAVTAAADDRTFVLDEQHWSDSENQGYGTRTFYEFRLSSAGRPGPLTRLPMIVPNGQLLTGLAMSPDGSKLAITVEPDNDKNEPNLTTVSVYTLATGAVRTWTGNGTIGTIGDDARSLSWTADGRTLAFDWLSASGPQGMGVRLLDLGASGRSLLADSRQVVSAAVQAPDATPTSTAPVSSVPTISVPAISIPAVPVFARPTATATATDRPAVTPSAASSSSLAITVPTCQQDSIITPDGSAVVCSAIATVGMKITASGLTRGAVTEFREYSAATGKITRILGQWRFASVGALSVEVLWSNPSGSVLIGVIPNAAGGRVGVIRGDTFSPLPAQVAGVSALTGTW